MDWTFYVREEGTFRGFFRLGAQVTDWKRPDLVIKASSPSWEGCTWLHPYASEEPAIMILYS
jgi:hypothetical protein